ncbi:MAG: hypothetical protein EHM28_00135 [Spirochaetaceae bacterium]|nr:MAG: hypothetical protein EHM28_00135 [Spirochaetaceae bacterium]
MGEYFDQIPQDLREHVRGLVASVKVDSGADALEIVSQAWLEKNTVFTDTLADMKMEELASLPKDSEKGALALTYSGSLVNIGPLVDGVRTVKYTSIGFRTNAPEHAESGKSTLQNDVSVGNVIQFSNGPVKSTSPIFKIAVCADDNMSPAEQQQTIFDAATVIEEEFIEVNKTVLED